GRWHAVATPGSAAARAGLVTGDELLRVNGRGIVDGSDLTAALRGVAIGRVVTAHVLRDGTPRTIRFVAEPYQRVRARLYDLPDPTDAMRRVRAAILTGR
ncbi:MAG: PDZ domain-containing protein, partial [Gemmatimonadales bacterium]